MSEVLDQLDVAPEVITPEQEPANEPEAQKEPEQKPVEPKEDPQEKNWKAARAQMEERARENKLLKQHLEVMQQELDLLRRSNPEPKEPEEDLSHLTETERRLYQEIQGLKKEIKQTKVKESDYVVDRLRAKYADFDEVVSPENITYLQTNNAALAKALASLKDDPYEQGIAAYDALRKTEWYQQRHTMQDKAKLEENSKKPMSVQAVRKQGALSEANRFANGLTPELKKALIKEMAEARKGA
jgi:hypothetical protein